MSDPRGRSTAAFSRLHRYEPASQRVGLVDIATAWVLAAVLIAVLALLN